MENEFPETCECCGNIMGLCVCEPVEVTLAVNGNVVATLPLQTAREIVECFRENVEWEMRAENGAVFANNENRK